MHWSVTLVSAISLCFSFTSICNGAPVEHNSTHLLIARQPPSPPRPVVPDTISAQHPYADRPGYYVLIPDFRQPSLIQADRGFRPLGDNWATEPETFNLHRHLQNLRLGQHTAFVTGWGDPDHLYDSPYRYVVRIGRNAFGNIDALQNWNTDSEVAILGGVPWTMVVGWYAPEGEGIFATNPSYDSSHDTDASFTFTPTAPEAMLMADENNYGSNGEQAAAVYEMGNWITMSQMGPFPYAFNGAISDPVIPPQTGNDLLEVARHLHQTGDARCALTSAIWQTYLAAETYFALGEAMRRLATDTRFLQTDRDYLGEGAELFRGSHAAEALCQLFMACGINPSFSGGPAPNFDDGSGGISKRRTEEKDLRKPHGFCARVVKDYYSPRACHLTDVEKGCDYKDINPCREISKLWVFAELQKWDYAGTWSNLYLDIGAQTVRLFAQPSPGAKLEYAPIDIEKVFPGSNGHVPLRYINQVYIKQDNAKGTDAFALRKMQLVAECYNVDGHAYTDKYMEGMDNWSYFKPDATNNAVSTTRLSPLTPKDWAGHANDGLLWGWLH